MNLTPGRKQETERSLGRTRPGAGKALLLGVCFGLLPLTLTAQDSLDKYIAVLCDTSQTRAQVTNARNQVSRFGIRALVPVLQTAKKNLGDKEKRKTNIRLLMAARSIIAVNNKRVSRAARDILAELANCNDFGTAYWARKCLGLLQTKEAARILADTVLRRNDHILATVQSIHSLGQTGQGERYIVRFIHLPRPEEREAVCDALVPAKYNSPAVLVALFRGLFDEDPRVRAAAIGQLKERHETKDRLGFMATKDEKERNAAIVNWYEWLKKRIGVSLDLQTLTELYDAPSPKIRKEVLERIDETRNPAAYLCCLRGLMDPSFEVRKAAYNAFEKLNPGRLPRYDPGDTRKELEEGTMRWFKWVLSVQRKIRGLKEADWLPLFKDAFPAMKLAILGYLDGVKTWSHLRCTLIGMEDDNTAVRERAYKALKTLIASSIPKFDPKGDKESRAASLKAIRKHINTHKMSMKGL